MSKSQQSSSQTSIFAFAPGESFMELLNQQSAQSTGYEAQDGLYAEKQSYLSSAISKEQRKLSR